jgi:hypothetical protein
VYIDQFRSVVLPFLFFHPWISAFVVVSLVCRDDRWSIRCCCGYDNNLFLVSCCIVDLILHLFCSQSVVILMSVYYASPHPGLHAHIACTLDSLCSALSLLALGNPTQHTSYEEKRLPHPTSSHPTYSTLLYPFLNILKCILFGCNRNNIAREVKLDTDRNCGMEQQSNAKAVLRKIVLWI